MPDGKAFVVTEIVDGATISAYQRSADRTAAKKQAKRPNAIAGAVGNGGWEKTRTPKAPVHTAVAKSTASAPSPAELKRLSNAAFLAADGDKKTFLAALEGLAQTVRLLDERTLADLIWRGQHSPGRDGFRATPAGERVNGTGAGVSLTSVESATEALVFGEPAKTADGPVRTLPVPMYDPAGMHIANLRRALAVCAAQVVDVIDPARDWLLGVHQSAPKDRDGTPEPCAACGKEIRGLLRRIDGQPYHAEGRPNCYRQVNMCRRPCYLYGPGSIDCGACESCRARRAKVTGNPGDV